MEESIETLGAAGHDIGEIPYLRMIAEEQAKHPADRIHRERDARLIRPLPESIDEVTGHLSQAFEKSILGNQFQCLQPGRHGHRITGQCAGLINRPQGSQLFHDVAATAKGSNGHAATDHLAQCGEVGTNAIQRLCAPQRHAEAGHDLIEDQHRAM